MPRAKAIPIATKRTSGRSRRKEPSRRPSQFLAHHGSDYNPAQVEFMLALDRYKTVNRRPFPTCAEVLDVLLSLGYSKQADEPKLVKR